MLCIKRYSLVVAPTTVCHCQAAHGGAHYALTPLCSSRSKYTRAPVLRSFVCFCLLTVADAMQYMIVYQCILGEINNVAFWVDGSSMSSLQVSCTKRVESKDRMILLAEPI